MCKSAPVLSLAGWICSATPGNTSSGDDGSPQTASCSIYEVIWNWIEVNVLYRPNVSHLLRCPDVLFYCLWFIFLPSYFSILAALCNLEVCWNVSSGRLQSRTSIIFALSTRHSAPTPRIPLLCAVMHICSKFNHVSLLHSRPDMEEKFAQWQKMLMHHWWEFCLPSFCSVLISCRGIFRSFLVGSARRQIVKERWFSEELQDIRRSERPAEICICHVTMKWSADSRCR